LALKKKGLLSFEKLVSAQTKTKRYISEYFNLKIEGMTGYIYIYIYIYIYENFVIEVTSFIAINFEVTVIHKPSF
jgi:hypothetical protein